MLKKKIGFKLGSANTVIFNEKNGVILQEPSIIAYNKVNRKIIAVGKEAKLLVGRNTPDIRVVQPIQNGAVADSDLLIEMITYFMKKIGSSKIIKNEFIFVVPPGITETERRATIYATKKLGASHAALIVEPLAIAYGSGMGVQNINSLLIVDLGSSTSTCTLTSFGGIVTASTLKVGGNNIDEAIQSYFKKNFGLILGTLTSEHIKISHGTILEEFKDYQIALSGRDLATRQPKKILVHRSEIKNAITTTVDKIIESIKRAIGDVPPDMLDDIIDGGIVLTGGSSKLDGIVQKVETSTNCLVTVPGNSLATVAAGAFKALEQAKGKKIS